jgi:amidase
MPFDDYESYDAVARAARVSDGDVKPRELIEAAIARAERRNPAINAIVIPMYDEGRRVAEAPPDGPFRGVPFLLKDLYAMYPGFRTTHGSRLFADHVPDHENELAARYRRAGLVTFGKSASPEFGRAIPGTWSSWRADLRAARRRRWPPASCRPRTRATAAARSAYPPRAVGCSA